MFKNIKFNVLLVVFSTILIFSSCSSGGGSSNDNAKYAASSSPSIVSLNSPATDKVTLFWLPASDGVTDSKEMVYEIYLSEENDFNVSQSIPTTTVIGITEVDIENLKADTHYYIKIKAIGKSGKLFVSDQNDIQTLRIDSELRKGIVTHQLGDLHFDNVLITDTQIVFTENNQTVVPKYGDIIIGDSDNSFLSRVTGIDQNSTHITLLIEQASMFDLFAQTQVQTSTTLFEEEPATSSDGIQRAISYKNNNLKDEIQWKSGRFQVITDKNITIPSSINSNSAVNRSSSRNSGSLYNNTRYDSFSYTIPVTDVLARVGVTTSLYVSFRSKSGYRMYKASLSTITGYKNTSIRKMGATFTKNKVTDTLTLGDLKINPPKEYTSEEKYYAVFHVLTQKESCARSDISCIESYDVEVPFYVGQNEKLKIELSKPYSIKEDGFKSKINLKFDPKVKVSAILEDNSLKKAEVILSGKITFNANIDLKYESKYKSGKIKKRIYKKTFRSYFVAGGVPVYQATTVSIDAQYEVDASSKIEASQDFTTTYTVLAGVVYKNGSWETVKGNKTTKEFKAELSVDGKASVKLRLIPKVQVRFYKIATAGISVEPYLQGNIQAHGDIKYSTKFDPYDLDANYKLEKLNSQAGVDVNINADLSVFGLGIYYPEKNKTKNIFNKEIELFSLPKLKIKIGAINKYGEVAVSGSATNGVNNPFDPSSVQWKVFPSDGVKIENEKLKNTSISFSKTGSYRIYFTGSGQRLNKTISNQYLYKVVEINSIEVPLQEEIAKKNIAPIASFTLPSKGYDYVDQTFSAFYSRDIDGYIEYYLWYDNNELISIKEEFTKKLSAGSHIIKLVVTDDKGARSTESKSIVITSAPEVFTYLNGTKTVKTSIGFSTDTTCPDTNPWLGDTDANSSVVDTFYEECSYQRDDDKLSASHDDEQSIYYSYENGRMKIDEIIRKGTYRNTDILTTYRFDNGVVNTRSKTVDGLYHGPYFISNSDGSWIMEGSSYYGEDDIYNLYIDNKLVREYNRNGRFKSTDYGIVIEGIYKNGLKNGVFIKTNADGIVLAKLRYKNDKLDGVQEVNLDNMSNWELSLDLTKSTDGNLHCLFNISNGSIVGTMKCEDKSGPFKYEDDFLTYKKYTKEGLLIHKKVAYKKYSKATQEEYTYANDGKLLELIVYYDDGKINKHERYRYDQTTRNLIFKNIRKDHLITESGYGVKKNILSLKHYKINSAYNLAYGSYDYSNDYIQLSYDNAYGPILQGKMERYNIDGTLKYSSFYKNGKLDGIEKYYYPSGSIEFLYPFKDGKREGIVKFYFADGHLSVTTPYKNDKQDGVSKSYFKDGSLSSSTSYKNDKKDGEKIEYYLSGNKSYYAYYSADEFLSSESYYDNTKNSLKEEHLIDGTFKTYYENGELKYRDQDGVRESFCQGDDIFIGEYSYSCMQRVFCDIIDSTDGKEWCKVKEATCATDSALCPNCAIDQTLMSQEGPPPLLETTWWCQDLCSVGQKHVNGSCVVKTCESDAYECPTCDSTQKLEYDVAGGGVCYEKTCKDDGYNCPECTESQELVFDTNNFASCEEKTCRDNNYSCPTCTQSELLTYRDDGSAYCELVCSVGEKKVYGSCVAMNCRDDAYQCPTCTDPDTLLYNSDGSGYCGSCSDSQVGVNSVCEDKTCENSGENCPVCLDYEELVYDSTGAGVCTDTGEFWTVEPLTWYGMSDVLVLKFASDGKWSAYNRTSKIREYGTFTSNIDQNMIEEGQYTGLTYVQMHLQLSGTTDSSVNIFYDPNSYKGIMYDKSFTDNYFTNVNDNFDQLNIGGIDYYHLPILTGNYQYKDGTIEFNTSNTWIYTDKSTNEKESGTYTIVTNASDGYPLATFLLSIDVLQEENTTGGLFDTTTGTSKSYKVVYSGYSNYPKELALDSIGGKDVSISLSR